MALKRNERYPGRFQNPTSASPQGGFKNRTSPTSQDGSYLESDWANDWDGFFGSLLSGAGITPNGNVDTATSSQYFNALRLLTLQRSNPFNDVKTDGNANLALSNLGVTTNATSTYVTAKIGSIILISGITSGTTTSDGNLNVLFPFAFPNAVFYFDVTQANVSYATDTNPIIFSPYPSPSGPVTTLGAAARNTKTGAAQVSTFLNARYIAVGN